MININKNNANNVVLTLTELTSLPLSSVTYLFAITSHSTKETIYFIADDISTATSRYNEFTLIETGSTYGNLTAGTFNLASGWFSYDVYEQTDPTNLNYLQASGIVESGIGFCTGETEQAYMKPNTGQNFFTYISG